MVKWQLMNVFHLEPKILLKRSQFLPKQRIIAACSLEPFNRVLPKHFKLYFSLNFIVSSLPKKSLVLLSCAVYKVLNLCEKYAPHILCLLALSPKLRLVPPPIHISTWQFWNHKSMKFPMKVESSNSIWWHSWHQAFCTTLAIRPGSTTLFRVGGWDLQDNVH